LRGQLAAAGCAVDNLADAASAYLKEVELAAGMQTRRATPPSHDA
jgi:hypothetical protein